MNRSLRRFPWLLVTALMAVWCVSTPLRSQPPVADENIVEASDELRDLLYEREELREDSARLQRETSRVAARLDALSELIMLQKEHDELHRRIESSEADTALVDDLEHQIEVLEIKIEHRHSLAENDEEQRDIESYRSRLPESLDPMIAKTLTEYVRHLQKLRDTMVELHQLKLDDGSSPARDELEQRYDQLVDDVESLRVSVDIIRDLIEAVDEDEEEIVEQLKVRLKQSLTTADDLAPDVIQDPAYLPIAVTAEALAEVAHLGVNDVVPTLRTYCMDCHNQDSQSGELDLERLISERPLVKNSAKWINVIEQLKNRVMPPADELHPDDAERRRVVLVLHNAIHNFDYSDIRDPGFETARRLTHQEYDNTVRDLLRVDLRIAATFPSDLTGTSGFDNSANSLFIQPLLIERYLGAAEKIVDAALPDAAVEAVHQPSRDLIFGQAPRDGDEEATARAFVRRFLLRAYRRPPSTEEVRNSLRQFREARQLGHSFDDAVKAVLRTVLVSPNFLIRSEQDQGRDGDYRINDWELASRLSYFLWASMPDEQLFQLARQGRLSEPDVLNEQVDRMLADPKSRTLGTIFASQWLGSQHVGTRVRLDPIDNPWCTESLMAAMRDETAMFFHTLVTENHPIQRLIDADFTFVNEELARHYRMSRVRGDHMRRVTVDTARRGGIFGQASLLAVTSFPYRTSPVVRGRWILADVLGTPPPPPPPNASELSEEIEENRRLTFRQKLEIHRRAPTCYTCHSQMDPLGFSLENYDWFGRWRNKHRRRPVDARGRLPNGTEFEGITGLKEVLVQQRLDDLHRQITRKMLSYALGRQLEYYDEPAMRTILSALQANDYRMQTLIREIVASYPFHYKKSRSENGTDT